MTKHERREAVAAILSRYLVTPTSQDAETLALIVESMPHIDPIRNAIEATLSVSYHDDFNAMEYAYDKHDMA